MLNQGVSSPFESQVAHFEMIILTDFDVEKKLEICVHILSLSYNFPDAVHMWIELHSRFFFAMRFIELS